MSIDVSACAERYRAHYRASGQQPHSAADWDARAVEMEPAFAASAYVDAFLARMDLSDCRSALDVGCGSGALALPLAARLREVHALDFSGAMLERLRAAAAARGLDTLHPIQRAWEDDWEDVPECDIVIASRSTQVPDLAAALAKLHAKARRRVCLTQRIGGPTPGADILAAIGRRRPPPPDWIHAIDILHAMGIAPRCEPLPGPPAPAPREIGFEALLKRCEWSLGRLDADERERLREWHARADPARRDLHGARRWMFIAWEKD